MDEEDEDRMVQLLKEKWFMRRQRTEEDETTEEFIMLQSELFQIVTGEDIMDKLRKNTRKETDIAKLLQERPDETWESEGIIYHKGRIYVPLDPNLRGHILHNNHDSPDVGHPGQHRMTELVKRTYWWPSMRNDIKRYIKGCDSCQRNKIIHGKKAAPLHPLPIPSAPWEEISIDLIRPLPLSNDKDAILVIVDRFSKMIRLIATKTDLML
jgi:hypothetical protein